MKSSESCPSSEPIHALVTGARWVGGGGEGDPGCQNGAPLRWQQIKANPTGLWRVTPFIFSTAVPFRHILLPSPLSPPPPIPAPPRLASPYSPALDSGTIRRISFPGPWPCHFPRSCHRRPLMLPLLTSISQSVIPDCLLAPEPAQLTPQPRHHSSTAALAPPPHLIDALPLPTYLSLSNRRRLFAPELSLHLPSLLHCLPLLFPPSPTHPPLYCYLYFPCPSHRPSLSGFGLQNQHSSAPSSSIFSLASLSVMVRGPLTLVGLSSGGAGDRDHRMAYGSPYGMALSGPSTAPACQTPTRLGRRLW